MKKIISGTELQEKILESIEILCGTVKETLGPKGNNVLINHSNFSPFITNDGVTIAKNIESEDETISAILEIIKESSIKTNDIVGDGTTTTLVLLESIYKQSLEYINKGEKRILLKKELNKTLEIILKELQKLKRKATPYNLKNIAYISSGDKNLGNLAYNVIKKVKRKEAINIRDSNEDKTFINYFKGYICNTTLASPYFLKNNNTLNYKNSYILLMNTSLTNIECISFILNDILKNKHNLIIIANNFDEVLTEELVSLTLTEKISICLLKIEDYGTHIYKILKDIELITNAQIIEQENSITSKNLGIVNNIEITNEKIRIDFNNSEKTNKYLRALKKEAKETTDDLEKEFLEKRIAMFSKGTAEISLGAPTKTECQEKRMRLEDALCALSASNNGILPGSGISLLQISNTLNTNTNASKIWKEVLKTPFEQITKNAGLNSQEILKKIEKNNFELIYNINDDTYENITNTKVIDPLSVVMQALINATSIAGMLITTTSLIINEYKNNLSNEKEYNNW